MHLEGVVEGVCTIKSSCYTLKQMKLAKHMEDIFCLIQTDHLLFLHSDDIIRSLEQNGQFLNKSAILF